MMKTLTCLFVLTCFCAAAQSPARTGKDYAVFFYVTKFQSGWPALSETETEAIALKKELEDHYGFIGKLVPNPTCRQIRDELAATNNRLQLNDQVLYFFSMHGYYRPDIDLGYLVAADGKYNDRYSESYLNYNDLRPYFSECKAKHVLVALDACYSGSFGTSRDRAKPDQPDYTSGPDCTGQVTSALHYTGRQYVCSGNKDARTPAKSAFAAKFLEALRKGANADGLLFFDDLTYWLGKVRIPEPESGAFAGHNPGGDFIFMQKNACAAAHDRDGDGVSDASDACPDNWGSQPNGCSAETKPDDTARDLAAWKVAKQQRTAAGYREYLRQFPQGEFKEPANQALRALEAEVIRQRDDTAWEVAKEKDTPEDYKKYLADWPNGLHRSAAEENLKGISKNSLKRDLNDGNIILSQENLSIFDGEWFSPDFNYSFRIKNKSGIATLSNSPNYYVGQEMLRIAEFDGSYYNAFQIYTDGNWHNIKIKLSASDCMVLEDSRATKPIWRMIKMH